MGLGRWPKNGGQRTAVRKRGQLSDKWYKSMVHILGDFATGGCAEKEPRVVGGGWTTALRTGRIACPPNPLSSPAIVRKGSGICVLIVC